MPVALRVEYLAKATTDLRIVANGKEIDWSAQARIAAVEAFDDTDKKMFTAGTGMQVGEKQAG